MSFLASNNNSIEKLNINNKSKNLRKDKNDETPIRTNQISLWNHEISILNLKSFIYRLKNIRCSILNYGYNYHLDKFYICLSCDPDGKFPFCENCLNNCHKNIEKHKIILKDEKKNMCHCGISNHKINSKEIINNIIIKNTCYLGEFNERKGVFLKNGKCEICNEICTVDKDLNELNHNIKDKKQLNKIEFQCNCSNIYHLESISYHNLKELYINKIFKMNKIQILNIIFSNNQIENQIYGNFMKEILLIKENILISREFKMINQNSLMNLINFTNFLILNDENKIFMFGLYNNMDMIKYFQKDSFKIKNSFNFKFIYNLLIFPFDNKNSYVWQFKENILNIYTLLIIEIDCQNFYKHFQSYKERDNNNLAINNFSTIDLINTLFPFRISFNGMSNKVKMKIFDINYTDKFYSIPPDEKNNFSINEYSKYLIEIIEHYINLFSLHNIINLHMICLLYRCLLTFSTYGFFNQNNIDKIIKITEIFFNSFYNKKLKFQNKEKTHCSIFIKFIIMTYFEILIQSIYFYNDEVFLTSFYNIKEIDIFNNKNVYISKSDFGKLINKSVIIIINVYNDIFKPQNKFSNQINLDNITYNNIIYKIINSQTNYKFDVNISIENEFEYIYRQIINLSLSVHDDIYSTGLSSFIYHNMTDSIEFNKYLNLFLKNELNREELNIENFIENEIKIIEELYHKVLNVEIYDIEKLESSIFISISNIFIKINEENFNYKKYIINKEKILFDNQTTKIFYDPNYSNLIEQLNIFLTQFNKSSKQSFFLNQLLLTKNINYLLCISKSIRILESITKSLSSNQFQIKEHMFESYLKLLYYFSIYNCHNSVLLLTKPFIEVYLCFTGNQKNKILELIINCLYEIYNSGICIYNFYYLNFFLEKIIKNINEEKFNFQSIKNIIIILQFISHIKTKDKLSEINLIRNHIHYLIFNSNDNINFLIFEIFIIALKNSYYENEKTIQNYYNSIIFKSPNSKFPQSVFSKHENHKKKTISKKNNINISSTEGGVPSTIFQLHNQNSSFSEFLIQNLKGLKFFPHNIEDLSNLTIDDIIKIISDLLFLLNSIFENNSLLKYESKSYCSLLSLNDVLIIFKRKDINFNFKKNILNFLNIFYISSEFKYEMLSQYSSIILSSPNDFENDYIQTYISSFIINNNLINIQNENIKINLKKHDQISYIEKTNVFNFNKEINGYSNNFSNNEDHIKLSLNLIGILLKYEIRNLLKQNLKNDFPSLNIYIINSIIPLLKSYNNKIILIIKYSNGEIFIEYYEILRLFLTLKKVYFYYLNDLNQNDEIFKISYPKEKFKDHENIINEDIKIINDLQIFNPLDFMIVYFYFLKHLQFFDEIYYKEKRILDNQNIQNLFKKSNNDNISNEVNLFLLSKEFNDKGIYEKKIIKLYISYLFGKNNSQEELNIIKILKIKNSILKKTFLEMLIENCLYSIENEHFIESLWVIFKLLQLETLESQKSIINYFSNNDNNIVHFLNYMLNLFLIFFTNIILENNNGLNNPNINYQVTFNIIKILKYLCEEHNQIFQEKFHLELKIFFEDIKFKLLSDFLESNKLFSIETQTSNSENIIINKQISLFDYMLMILVKLILLSEWESYIVNIMKIQNISAQYYYNLLICICDFCIEMVQGTSTNNLNHILYNTESSKIFLNFLNNVKPLLTNKRYFSFSDNEMLVKSQIYLLNVILSFIEEKNTPKEIIGIISQILIPNEILDCISLIINNLSENILKNEISNFNSNYFCEKKNKILEEIFFTEMNFSEIHPIFEFGNRMFHYLTLLSEEYKIESAIDLLNENKNINSRFYYIILFFSKINKIVEVQQDNSIQRVIYTVHPLTKHLSEKSLYDFIENVDRTNRYTKLISLINNFENFYEEIQYNYINSKKSNLFNYLNKFNFTTVQYISFFLLLVLNIIYISRLYHESYHISEISNHRLRVLFNSDQSENNKLEYFYDYETKFSFGNEIETRVYYLLILILGIIIIIINFISSVIWVIFKFPLYFIIEKKHLSKNPNMLMLLWFYMKIIFTKKEMINQMWNIIFPFLAIIRFKYSFFFGIQLLIVCNLSITLKSIVKSLVLRYQQILLIFVMVFIFLNMFSFLYFFITNKDFIGNAQYGNNYYLENYCGTLFYCATYIFDYTLRFDTNLGENEKEMIYSSTDDYGSILKRVILHISYFIIIVIVLLALIFGILVDTFAEERTKNQQKEYDKDNICFICDATKEDLEKDKQNFIYHINVVHNIKDYVNYLIGLKFEDIQETNAINSSIIDMLEKQQIGLFPKYRNT